ncbi:hypothetical protein [Polyangium mundeleinium]|uniref:Secreted protein n=1 Tax=Polyangium mundeleinium TaxID=2995306 RepID=A0ABT5ETD6_9BACT|nr:hypothetical protein [Polyangium mundeleinium]MDC0745088.1 hypothetical protein [Polyangium mundeleinium]
MQARREDRGKRAMRAVVSATALILAAGSCVAPPPPKTRATSDLRCDKAALATCEGAIAAAAREERDPTALLDAYVAARAERDAADRWASLWRDAKSEPKARGAKSVVLREQLGNDTPSPRVSARKGAVEIRTGPLPRPASIDASALLAAMGASLGWETIARVTADAKTLTEIFPNDPLRPFMAGLPPVVQDIFSRDPEGILDLDLEIAQVVRHAAEHAASFRYVDAAGEAERLSTLLDRRSAASERKASHPSEEAEPVLRGRYLLTLLESAGIALEPPAGEWISPYPHARSSGPPGPDTLRDGTPYGHLLRVRAAEDDGATWKVVGEAILAAVPEGKREGIRALFGPQEACVAVPPPSFQGPDDLAFAYTMGRALTPSLSLDTTRNNLLPLAEWLPRYDAFVRTVDEARTTWTHAFALTQQRGELSGISLAQTPTYRRASTLVSAHLAALSQLHQAHPDRMRSMSVVTLAYAPGLVSDATLRDALVDLLRRTIEDRLARAKDASEVFEAAFTGALAATAYPAAIQSAFYTGLVGAFRKKLDGDLARQSGWGVAGLFTADVLVRMLLGERPDLDAAAARIGQALADPSVARRPLARLAASVARYLALGSAGKLDPDAAEPARFPADRKAARDALRESLAGLGDGAEPMPAGLLDDVVTLGDQTITALATILLDKPAGAEPKCGGAKGGPSPATRRVLARIGDVRRRILASPSYAKGDGATIRRARFVVTILSDAIDVASPRKNKAAPFTFVIPAADADRAFSAGLAAWEERAFADAITSIYGLVRTYLAEPKGSSIDATRVKSLLSALAAIFREEGAGTPVGLLDALARAAAVETTQGGLDALLVSLSGTLRAQGKQDQADFCLLGGVLVSIATDKPPPDAAIAAASSGASELGWALRFAREVFRARHGEPPRPSEYAEGMRGAVTRACEDPGAADAVVSVMEAMQLANTGDRAKAREKLDAFLAKAESSGLVMPRMSYRYDEKTVSKVFNVSFDVSFGAGLLEGSSTFQMGLGVRSPGKPEGSFTARLAPIAGPERDTEAARYYVHAAAVAAAYHFLDGDAERGASAASRAIDAAIFGARLGGRSLGPADPKTLAADARAVLAVTAVLAADAGMPLLAGDLWSLVRATLAEDTDDAALREILSTTPVAFAGMPTAKPLLDRAARALAVLGEPLACTEDKVELGGYEAPACDAYALALSLRAGGALRKLPRIRRGDTGKACAGPLPALDVFLGGMDQKNYDPDAFTRATLELASAGRVYDAALLLARQRQPSHCNPSLLSAARSIGRSKLLGPSLRADTLSVAVNCAPLDDAALDDLAALDADTTALADRSRNLSVLVFATELGLTRDRWDVLAKLARSPTFVSRWLDTTPHASLFALVLAHAVAILAKEPTLAEPASRSYDLFCVTLPPADKAACEAVRALRQPEADPEVRAKRAREAVSAALQRITQKARR